MTTSKKAWNLHEWRIIALPFVYCHVSAVLCFPNIYINVGQKLGGVLRDPIPKAMKYSAAMDLSHVNSSSSIHTEGKGESRET